MTRNSYKRGSSWTQSCIEREGCIYLTSSLIIHHANTLPDPLLKKKKKKLPQPPYKILHPRRSVTGDSLHSTCFSISLLNISQNRGLLSVALRSNSKDCNWLMSSLSRQQRLRTAPPNECFHEQANRGRRKTRNGSCHIRQQWPHSSLNVKVSEMIVSAICPV